VIGEILGETWEVYKRFFTHVVAIAFVFYLVIAGASLLLGLALGVAGAFIAAVLAFIGYFWLSGALVESVADIRDGRADLTIGQTISRVQPRLWTLLAAGLLAGLGILLGFVLLIVPGFILLTWWALTGPVVVLERLGVTASLGRSKSIVSGNGWRVLAILIITWIILAVARSIVAAIFAWAPGWASGLAADLIGSSLTAPFAAIAITLTYFRLTRQEQALEPATAEAGPTPA
jgi:hypothetical protein